MELKMRRLIFCVFVVTTLRDARGDEAEQVELLESFSEEEALECFRCDLGFFDACYTTETRCGAGERCYTGRGRAADALDVKTLGCATADECDVETTVEIFSNNTIFVMTKHCCDTPFCNSAHTLPVSSLLCLSVALISHMIQFITVV